MQRRYFIKLRTSAGISLLETLIAVGIASLTTLALSASAIQSAVMQVNAKRFSDHLLSASNLSMAIRTRPQLCPVLISAILKKENPLFISDEAIYVRVKRAEITRPEISLYLGQFDEFSLSGKPDFTRRIAEFTLTGHTLNARAPAFNRESQFVMQIPLKVEDTSTYALTKECLITHDTRSDPSLPIPSQLTRDLQFGHFRFSTVGINQTTFNLIYGRQQTSTLNRGDSDEKVQAALELIPDVGSGNVLVFGPYSGDAIHGVAGGGETVYAFAFSGNAIALANSGSAPDYYSWSPLRASRPNPTRYSNGRPQGVGVVNLIRPITLSTKTMRGGRYLFTSHIRLMPARGVWSYLFVEVNGRRLPPYFLSTDDEYSSSNLKTISIQSEVDVPDQSKITFTLRAVGTWDIATAFLEDLQWRAERVSGH